MEDPNLGGGGRGLHLAIRNKFMVYIHAFQLYKISNNEETPLDWLSLNFYHANMVKNLFMFSKDKKVISQFC